MTQEIITETIIHPEFGEITKKYIYTYDGNGIQINKEFYIPPVAEDLVIDPAMTPATITENKNNYNPTGLAGVKRMRLSTIGNITLTGINATGMVDGKVLILENINSPSHSIRLSDNNPLSNPANRFYINGDKVLSRNESCILIYDAVSSRWRMSARSI